MSFFNLELADTNFVVRALCLLLVSACCSSLVLQCCARKESKTGGTFFSGWRAETAGPHRMQDHNTHRYDKDAFEVRETGRRVRWWSDTLRE